MATTNSPPPFRAEDFSRDGKKHILLGSSGSVAAIKLPDIVCGLFSTQNISIRIILTAAATHFFSGVSDENPSVDSLRVLPRVEGVYTDADEWLIPWQRGNAILHIELRKWADVMLVAPLDANTLAKMTGGIADNLLTSVLRAWDPEGVFNPVARSGWRKTLAVAPAMNTAMWLHPVTEKQIRILEREWGLEQRMTVDDVSESLIRPWARVLRPIEKALACGDVGSGAMMDWKDIVEEILSMVKQLD